MAPKGNRVRNLKAEDIAEVAEKPKSKETTREKTKKTALKRFDFSRVTDFFNNEKLHKVTGLFLILISVFMLVAFTSFFFTWNADHDKVSGSWWSMFSRPDIQVDNWLGKFGAIIAHQFIEKWFGISAFVFVLLSFLTGFKILFRVELLPIGKTVRYAFFAFFFVAASLGYMLSTKGKLLFLAGAFGFEINRWLESFLGAAGAGLFLVFAAVAFIVVTFNVAFRLPAFFNRKEQASVEEALRQTAMATIPGNRIKEDLVEEVGNGPVTLDLETNLPEDLDENENAEEESLPTATISFDIDNEVLPVPIHNTEMEVKLPNLNADVENPVAVPLSIEPIPAGSEPLDEKGISTTEVLGEYDPKLDLSSYKFPTTDLLENYVSQKTSQNIEELKAELEANKNRIVETLGHYNIAIDKIKATVGPTVTLFEIIPQAGVRISKIKNLEDDIALSLSALGIRIIAPIPGKGTIGIEVPNQNPEIVSMRSVIASDKFQNCDYDLPIGLGRTISNEVFIADLAKMPHLLMAGATGQGKSVGLNAVLVSLLYKKHPSQVKFVLVDPKKVELTLFKTIERHFLAKLPGEDEAIITDTRKVVNTLNSLCIEMDQRYELLKDAQVRNIREYNAKFVSRRLNPNNGHRFLPFIVLVVDEFADLIMTAGKEIETPIARLAQLARAIGIHLIIATQRPSVNIITGTIKANFPARMAFRVTSKIDSRTILDTGGADQLIGRGDMLLSTGADLIRLQCAFVDTPEVDQITEYIGSQRGYPEAFMLPEYVGENEGGSSSDYDASDRDPLFDDAARMVVQHQQGSASLLQRRLKLGYNRAGRLIDQLEAAGIIGPFEGSKAREVKVKDPMSLEQFLTVPDKP
ncbi:MAG: DNA translocase FtsK [Bacteroidota bacterium]|nr:DNA translocase FtsK [Bacteroidota bacterium]